MRFRLSAPTTCALPAWPALAGSIAPAISTPWISSSGATRTASLDHLYSQTLTFAFKLQTISPGSFSPQSRCMIKRRIHRIYPLSPFTSVVRNCTGKANEGFESCRWNVSQRTPRVIYWPSRLLINVYSTLPRTILTISGTSLLVAAWSTLTCPKLSCSCFASAVECSPGLLLEKRLLNSAFQNPAQEGVQAKNWSSHFGRDDNFSLSTTKPFVKAESLISTSVMLSIGIFLRCASNVPLDNWQPALSASLEKLRRRLLNQEVSLPALHHLEVLQQSLSLQLENPCTHDKNRHHAWKCEPLQKEQLSYRKHASWSVFNDSSNPMLWRLRSLLVCMLTCDVCSGTSSWMPNANLLKRQQAADVRNGYFQSFPQGFNMAALDAFGPPWTPANCRARIGENHHRLLGRPFWAKPVLRMFSGPRIGPVGGSCFVDDFVSCWGKRGAYRLLLEPSWR